MENGRSPYMPACNDTFTALTLESKDLFGEVLSIATVSLKNLRTFFGGVTSGT